MSTPPIATYDEVRFEGSRTFTLLPDAVLIRGKQTLESEFETRIRLATLEPEPDRLSTRSKYFNAGLFVAVVAGLGCTILAEGVDVPLLSPAVGLVACIVMSGVVMMLATYKKVEWVRFQNDGGIHALDIARAGKNADHFESFVDAVSKQIGAARAAASDGNRQLTPLPTPGHTS